MIPYCRHPHPLRAFVDIHTEIELGFASNSNQRLVASCSRYRDGFARPARSNLVSQIHPNHQRLFFPIYFHEDVRTGIVLRNSISHTPLLDFDGFIVQDLNLKINKKIIFD